MPRVPNPYFAGPPVTQPDTFFGRQDVLDFVDDTLASPMHNVIVFYGQRRIGKTSILHQIARRARQDYEAVFFDLQSSVDRSAHDLLYGLAREVAVQLQLPPPDRAEFRDNIDTFRTDFLPRVHAHLGDQRLLLLLDEFDALSLEASPTDWGALPFVQALNRMIQSSDKRVIFLFVVGRRLKDLSSQQLQIFRGARDRQITLLDREATTQLITRPAQGILTYQNDAVERIWFLTSGHPYFTQLICHELFTRAQRQNRSVVTEAHVDAVIDDAVSSGQSALQWFWEEVPPVERFTLYTIGQLAAEWEGASLDQLITQRNAYGVQVPDFELRAIPDQLVDRQVLKRDAQDRYRMAVELVRRWIVRTHSLEEVTTELTRTAAVDEPAKTFFKAGLAAYREDDVELAIENFSRALSVNPDYVEARLWLARSRARAGELLVAIDEFAYVERFGGRESREARIRLADARTQYGQRLEAEGKIDEAVQEYERVLELDPRHAEANTRLSEIFQQRASERLAEQGVATARPLYERALEHRMDVELEQKIKEQLDQYVQAQEAVNNWEEAEQAGRLSAELMSMADDNQEALLHIQLGRGRWHLNHDELEAAADVYQRVLVEFAGDVSRQMIENDILRYSQQQEEENNWDQSEAALSLLVRLFPDDLEHRGRLADNLCRQAEFYLDQDDFTKSRTTYQRALADEALYKAVHSSIRAGFQSYRRSRAEQKAVQARKQVEEAMLVLTDILGREDTLAYQWLAEARTELGDALRAEERLAEARATYERAVDDVTHVLQFAHEPAQAYQQRAATWLKLGQVDLDEARFDQAIERFNQALVDAGSDRTLVEQLKTALNDYRRQQEEMLRWNQAERALEMLDRLLPGEEEIQFWLAETRAAHANWHLRRAIPDLDAARRLARSALLDVHLSYANRDVIGASLKESFQVHRLQQEQATPPNWSQAEQALNSLVSLLPDDPEVHHWLAQTRASQADWYLAHESQSPVEARRYLLKAAEACRRALNDWPEDESLVSQFKESFKAYRQRQTRLDPPAWSLAEQAMQILTELLPQDGEVRQWLAETFLDQGNWLLQRDPSDLVEARSYLAEAKEAYGNALQVALVDKSILEAPIQAQFNVYWQQRTRGEPPQWALAEEGLEILGALLPGTTETRQQQAELYVARGDWLLVQEPVDLTKVEDSYRQALAGWPGSTDVLAARLQESVKTYRLKQQRARPPNWEAAEQAVEVLATLLPDHDETRWQWAELYAERGRWYLRHEITDPAEAEAALDEAEQYYRRALEAVSEDKSALVAQIKEDFNDYHLEQLRAEPPRWPLAEKAIGILVALPFEDEEAPRRLADVRATWARSYLQRDVESSVEAGPNLAQAEEIYQRALAQLPGEPAFLVDLIKEDLNAYRLRQEQADPPRWHLAERALHRLTELVSNDEEVHGWLVETYLAHGRHLEDEAQSMSGGWRWESQQLDTLDSAEQIYRQAVAAAERRTELAPENPTAWQQLAVTLTRLGHVCRLSGDETEALALYDQALAGWQTVRELGAETPHRQEIANTHVARGDIRLQGGDLLAAGQDYVAASELTPTDRPWLPEVDQRLQEYKERQKSMGIQRQVVAVEEIRYRLQPDNPEVRHGYAAELVAYGSQFLGDDEFELARQRYEQAMQPDGPELDDVERRRLSRNIVQDVSKFIQRQERANNRRQADEARAWLNSAGFLAEKPALVPASSRQQWRPRWLVIAAIVIGLFCVGAVLVSGREGLLASLIAMINPPTETPTPLPTATLSATATPTRSEEATAVAVVPTETPMPTDTPVPPTLTPTATNTIAPTETPTPSPTFTVTPTPTATSTYTPTPFPTLELLGPEDDEIFRGASSLPRLAWEPLDLGVDQRYVVTLRFLEDGQSVSTRFWFNTLFWEMPVEFFHRADPLDDSGKREFQWQLVVAQIQPDGDIGEEVSDPTELRSFTWEPILLPEGEAPDVVVNPDNELEVLVVLKDTGIYKSDNGGIDWRLVSDEPSIETLHIAPADTEVVYAGAFAEIVKSEDEGETWRASSIPPRAQVYAITTDPDEADLVFAATDRGVLRSGDGGQTWFALDRAEGLNRPFYSLVAVTTSRGDRIYAAGEGDQIYWRGTDDVFSRWERLICMECNPPIFALAIDPGQDGKLLAGSDEGALVVSLDLGQSWEQATIPRSTLPPNFSVLAVDPSNPKVVYAGSGTNRTPELGQGLYRSLDGGLTWHRFNNWTPGRGENSYIQGIAVTDEVIFIAGSEGVFRSDDGGDSWIKQ